MAIAAQPAPTATKLEEEELLLTGSEAIAHALRLADVDIVAAYPIRPYDAVMQAVATMIANGQMDCEYIVAEGEHSQFEIVKHASAVGARSFVGSSGVGWFYAFESIAVTAGLRLPVVANVGNRALDDPGAFGVEHNDTLAVRDLGWLMTWVETGQEAFDSAVIGYRVAEDPRIMLPCAVSTDGAFLTHSQHLVKIPPRSFVDQYLPKYNLGDRLFHPDNPITIAPQVDQDWLTEIRKQNDAAMRRAPEVIREAYREFYELTGRQKEPFIEEYMTDDADYVFVGQGTIAMPGRVIVRRLREQGHKVGFARLKWFRPFPTDEVVTRLSRFKGLGIIDRDYSFGSPNMGGVLYTEFRAALYDSPKRPAMVNFIAGLGGREVTVTNGEEMFNLLQRGAAGELQTNVHWIGVRE
ncbi:MAG: pyruvate ferredoxin oxidoreductase [Chloroflexi bacterium]|nr:pyruvate ferredoxin oxidoreductase [Chloroflexota bacterium]MBV9544855.1 pyruvate ferredoxin oxidoreductase [Chloroflexota bacterium]